MECCFQFHWDESLLNINIRNFEMVSQKADTHEAPNPEKTGKDNMVPCFPVITGFLMLLFFIYNLNLWSKCHVNTITDYGVVRYFVA